MRVRSATLVMLALAVTLASTAVASSAATRQRVAITSKDLPDGTFVLTPYQAGAVKRDSGTTSIVIHDPVRAMRKGQSFEIYLLDWTFTGRRGTLEIQERNEWLDTGDAYIAYGTWKVVRGTGQYARVTGSGRSAGVGHDRGEGAWFARQEGFLTPR